MRHDPRPIPINPTVKQTCFTIHDLCGQHKGIPEETIVIRLSRRGADTPLIEYPAKIIGENLCFEWGQLMYSLASGRYDGYLYEGETCFAHVQFDVTPNQWRVEQAEQPKAPKRAIGCDACGGEPEI